MPTSRRHYEQSANWDKYLHLDGRLTCVTHAFGNTHVSGGLAGDARLQQLRRDWETLMRVRSLGFRRNEVVHTVLGWSDGKRIRADRPPGDAGNRRV